MIKNYFYNAIKTPFYIITLRVYTTLLLLFTVSLIYGQTGPGGVGSSASNVMWLDANRGVSLSAGHVTSWLDQSGNSFTAVPSSAAAQPSLEIASANGFPSLKFDGTDDELWVNDDNKLDLTQWHFFLVPKVNTQKDYNAWLTKGNDSQENFEMLTYGDAHFHTPILFTDGNRAFLDATSVLVTTTEFDIFEYSYSSPVGRDVYKNYSAATNTDNENRTPTVNSFSLYIGNEKSTTGRFTNANLAEVIMYNGPLNSAQRVVVNNYLAAKYNCTLTTNDVYAMDTPANGNFDYDVAGIGRVDASNIQSDSRGSGVVEVLNPVGLDNGEYYMWGHNNGALGAYASGDVPTGVQNRVIRIWRGSQVGTITSMDIQFDLTGMGSVTASDLRLLIDVDNNGAFANETTGGGGVISGASSVGGNVYRFSGVTGLKNNLRFTLGTSNYAATPLPVTLLGFEAMYAHEKVQLSWSTATEKNSSQFTAERSQDGIHFTDVGTVAAAGTSSRKLDYSMTDEHPVEGISYYRLKQTDLDNSSSYSSIVTVNVKAVENGMTIFPNPAESVFTLSFDEPAGENIKVLILSSKGKKVFSADFVTAKDQRSFVIDTQNQLSSGMYVVVVVAPGRRYKQLVVIH